MNVVRTALSWESLRRTVPVAVLVGSILTAVNSGPRLAAGDVDGWLAVRVVLTVSVPWLNATYGYAVGRRHVDLVDDVDQIATLVEAT